jgi:hypothetical protein
MGPCDSNVPASRLRGLACGMEPVQPSMHRWHTIRSKTGLYVLPVYQCLYGVLREAASSALCRHKVSPESCGDGAPKLWLEISSNAIA